MGNATVNDLENDAEKALEVLIQQPEVDSNSVTLVGHSEGTMYVTRVAINYPDIVDNIVLMGTLSLGYYEEAYYQAVILPILYARQILDHNHNGFISIQKHWGIVFSTLFQ
jgi:uncharacterized protein